MILFPDRKYIKIDSICLKNQLGKCLYHRKVHSPSCSSSSSFFFFFFLHFHNSDFHLLVSESISFTSTKTSVVNSNNIFYS